MQKSVSSLFSPFEFREEAALTYSSVSRRCYLPHLCERYAELSGNSRRRESSPSSRANCIYLAARQRDVLAGGARRFVFLRRSSVSSLCLCKCCCEKPRQFFGIKLAERVRQVLGQNVAGKAHQRVRLAQRDSRMRQQEQRSASSASKRGSRW